MNVWAQVGGWGGEIDGIRCSRNQFHMIMHLHPFVGGAYGSSPFPTGPHTDGTCNEDITFESPQSLGH